jgi:GAF domain-containing protein/CheY-like chemotaxis protein
MFTRQSDVERQAQLLEAAARVGHAVTSLLDPDELFSQVVDIICDTYGFYYAGVFLFDPHQPGYAILRTGRGELGRKLVEQGHRLKIDDTSMIGWCIGHKEARITPDVHRDAVHRKVLPETRSEMALPLMVGGQVIGALTIQSAQNGAFTEMDITSLQAMADQLAIAIENARVHTQIQHDVLLLEIAAEVGRNVTSILELDELLPRTVDLVCESYGFYYAAIFILDETGQWAVLRAGHGEAGRKMLERGHKLEVGDHSMVGWCIAHLQARIALDVGQEAVRFENPLLPETRSEMALPLIVGHKAIGAVSAQSKERAAFNHDDITALQAMADLLAVSIENARLLIELEEAHRELVRTKTFEAIASATSEAIHWIGNKAMPIVTTVKRMRDDVARAALDKDAAESLNEDLDLIEESARLILAVKEGLIGPAREHRPRPAIIQDVLHDAVVRLGLAGLVTYQIGEGVPLARVDTTQMSRAFTTLLKNAVEAMAGRPQPRITIGVCQASEPEMVEVKITDTGCGIPAANLDKIWVTFFTTKNSKEHLGLGLPACLQIVQQMEGKISAQSESGAGTTFTILLPAITRESKTCLPADNQAVLIVDDDDAWRRFAVSALQGAGYRVTAASTVIGLDAAAFDHLFVDQTLEQTTVQDVLRVMGQSARMTVVLTSSLVVEQTKELLRLGAQDIVLKPYSVQELAALL